MVDITDPFASPLYPENNCIDDYERYLMDLMDLMDSYSFFDSLNFSEFEPNNSTRGRSDIQIEQVNEGSRPLLNKKRRKKHDKYAGDNIKTKVQRAYLRFIVFFVNLIIRVIFRKFNGFNGDFENKEIKDKYQFKKLEYDLSRTIKKESFNLLKSKTLKDIFIHNTSRKNTRYNNDDVYKNVIKINNKIDSILNQKYLEFFPIFYQKNNYTNLSKYDLDIDISLENLENFDFFKNKELEKIKEPENQIKYAKRIEESIRDNFMINSHLFIIKK